MPTRLFLLAVLGVSTALAASGPLSTHAEIAAAFHALDSNGSGAIFPDEWRAASLALFAALDKNHDGLIERAEIDDNALVRDTLPTTADGQNAKLTKDEYLEWRDTIFNDADIERAGYLTFVEYELLVVMQRTGWSDTDHRGHVEMSDLRGVLEQAFKLLDVNHDGVLTGDETAFLAPAHLSVMDPKKSGRITLGQLINGFRFLLGADEVNRNVESGASPP